MATLNPVQIIRGIYGHEPRRENEYPVCYEIGSCARPGLDAVTSIVERGQDLGDRGIQWYDVWCKDQRIASVNATAVAEIQYATASIQGT